MRVVIVGGVAGGMSAATRLRRLMDDAEIIVLEKGPYASFANCGLPYYIGGEIEKREALLVVTPERLQERYRLDVRVNSEVIRINADQKEVTVRKNGQEYALTYDKLLLSPGAKPFVPPIENLELANNVFSVRNIPDVDKIMEHIENQKAQHAVVIGAGFIGLEMAENLKHRGLEVVIIEKALHVLPPVDEEMAAYIEKELVKQKIQIHKNVSVQKLEDEGKKVILDNGKVIATDLIISAVGVRADSDLAKTAGIETNHMGGIIVDDHYETNIKDVFAVGDAIVVKHWITKDDVMIALASPANRQGRQVADVIAGIKRKNKGSLGTAIVRVFDQVIASTGLNEHQLKQAKIPYEVIHVQGKNHAGYFPNNSPILLKILFDKQGGKLYGAQAVGVDGIDKRIDIVATAIKANQTIYDLVELELTYAPPFGSAKDVVNMAGYAAMNIIEGLSETIQWHEVETYRQEGAVLLDVREPSEFERSHIKGFINIPLDDLAKRLQELPKDKTFIVSCFSGMRSYLAERLLKQHGYKVKNLDGAYALYSVIHPEDLES